MTTHYGAEESITTADSKDSLKRESYLAVALSVFSQERTSDLALFTVSTRPFSTSNVDLRSILLYKHARFGKVLLEHV